MAKLPRCARISVTVYLISLEGLTAAINIGGGFEVPKDFDPIVAAATEAANEIAGVDDFRPMTDAEVEVYLEDEENDDE